MILGGLIDYGTGAVYDLQPNPMTVTLACEKISHLDKEKEEQNVKVIERVIVREVGEESHKGSYIDKHGDLRM